MLRDLILNLALYIYFDLARLKRNFDVQRKAVFEHAFLSLSQVSDDVAERALIEGDLARAWSSYRA